MTIALPVLMAQATGGGSAFAIAAFVVAAAALAAAVFAILEVGRLSRALAAQKQQAKAQPAPPPQRVEIVVTPANVALPAPPPQRVEIAIIPPSGPITAELAVTASSSHSAFGEPDEDTLVAILTAAAVAAVDGKPVRIRSIAPARQLQGVPSAWSEAGRHAIHASHRVGKVGS